MDLGISWAQVVYHYLLSQITYLDSWNRVYFPFIPWSLTKHAVAITKGMWNLWQQTTSFSLANIYPTFILLRRNMMKNINIDNIYISFSRWNWKIETRGSVYILKYWDKLCSGIVVVVGMLISYGHENLFVLFKTLKRWGLHYLGQIHCLL